MRWLVVVALAAACGDPKLSVDELQDPNTCNDCHPKHFQEWSGSMHAYASDDPVFVAMNKRGQRDTNGELGDFCVRCHAPMALLRGETTGATFDPAALSPAAKGVTCYFCHNVESIEADHNNGLVIAMDQTMRGGLKSPIESSAHFAAYDKEMSGLTTTSRMCGSCHDVVTPAGVHIERTFAEWNTTVFANANDDPNNFFESSCAKCHMRPTSEPVAETAEAGTREYGFHDHRLPAIDQALTPFPEREDQAKAVQSIYDAGPAIIGLRPFPTEPAYGGICLDGNDTITVRVDTPNLGHNYPSGAAQDRRSWVEVIAYNAAGTVIYDSGVVPDGMDPEDINDQYVNCTLPGKESCSGFWDRTFKADGSPAHFFWEVATVDSKLLLPQTVLEPYRDGYDHSRTVRYLVGPTIVQQVDKIVAKVKTRPLPYHVIDDLIASGDLDPSVRGELKTLEGRSGTSTWLRSTAGTGQAINTRCNPF
jgi:hypothetical protein